MLKLPATFNETARAFGLRLCDERSRIGEDPEGEDVVVSSLKEVLDPRFTITLTGILDPRDQGLSLEEVKQYVSALDA